MWNKTFFPTKYFKYFTILLLFFFQVVIFSTIVITLIVLSECTSISYSIFHLCISTVFLPNTMTPFNLINFFVNTLYNI